ncbi:hypothetical protein [Silvibacterium dinghuense]|uniref:Major facilitator superfamily (MFS) profile domain-containing protein n=1 Tax=Silvibacterium dinghuense TaxID=1560006 RepID=A0A4Q1SEP7_9BACT|nr:hypothetical protein [Silvibacterium dinghuense]RXS95561.1 hypothetical protein ESZ00_13420 [Silvibacterium dinghuense]GGH14036.1 hypothetical protein GCM10011586_34260 [Silvibacterium dinghuense]
MVLGIVVTPVAVHFASIFALGGPAALRLLYPYVLLLKNPVLGLSSELSDAFSQGMMYAQFPLYGLLMMLTLRSRGVVTAFGSAAVMHLLGVFVLFLLAHLQGAPHMQEVQ